VPPISKPPASDHRPEVSPWDGRRAPPAVAAAPASVSTLASITAGDPLDPLPAQRPTLRFACAHPLHALALGFGSGLPRFAPGTWGTLAAWAIFVALDPLLSDLAWAGVIAATLLLGALAAQRTADALGTPDSSHIVVDEMVAFWIVLLLLPADAAHPGWLQAAAFGLFRLFDIAKPAPIRWLDARIDNGLGVMLDDLVAALYTLLVIAVAWRLL
jgi:phosphatidylglycerophosphatase A